MLRNAPSTLERNRSSSAVGTGGIESAISASCARATSRNVLCGVKRQTHKEIHTICKKSDPHKDIGRLDSDERHRSGTRVVPEEYNQERASTTNNAHVMDSSSADSAQRCSKHKIKTKQEGSRCIIHLEQKYDVEEHADEADRELDRVPPDTTPVSSVPAIQNELSYVGCA